MREELPLFRRPVQPMSSSNHHQCGRPRFDGLFVSPTVALTPLQRRLYAADPV